MRAGHATMQLQNPSVARRIERTTSARLRNAGFRHLPSPHVACREVIRLSDGESIGHMTPSEAEKFLDLLGATA